MAKRVPLQGMRSAVELAAARPHGDRLRYIAGCRCDECRAANSAYERMRQAARKAGDWNGLVDAAAARRHLRKLSREGVGRRAVRVATDLGASIIQDIKAGRKKRIRARAARKILAVTRAMALDGALVPANKARAQLEELKDEGYAVKTLTARLGLQSKYQLQIAKSERVTVRNAGRVARLHRQLTE